MISTEPAPSTLTQCYHCGDKCDNHALIFDDKSFCCNGCLQVYQILNAHELSEYYCLNTTPGSKVESVSDEKFKFLEENSIAEQLIKFQNKYQIQAEFHLPQIHCSSCLWLLEHLSTINEAIISSQVNFTTKNVLITFDKSQLTIRQIAELLASIGYEPHIDIHGQEQDRLKKKYNTKTAYLKIGIAGFAFSNIMLISFPDYLGLELDSYPQLANFFRYINLFLSLPVVFYCAQEFFINAYYSFKQKYLNIDAPIALAIAVTFIRSVYEVLSGTGTGFFDSMTGIVFFMLLGRTLQNRTYTTLSFNRDYHSYFSLAVTRIDPIKATEEVIKIEDIHEHDILWIHHGEVFPTDCMLSKGQAQVDYSFITGETLPETIETGELIYAGGKNKGDAVEVLCIKPFSQNSFTQLWNNPAFKKETNDKEAITTIISKYFSLAIILIAISTFIYWKIVDPNKAWQAATAVLIVACPCSLLLTSSFTNGYLLDILSRKGFYLKNSDVIEKISQINHVAFDKTGTITSTDNESIELHADHLSKDEWNVVINIMNHSTHPLSQAIVRQFNKYKVNTIRQLSIKEVPGKGIEAWYEDKHYKIGSRFFTLQSQNFDNRTEVIVTVDNELKAVFQFKNVVKTFVPEMLRKLNLPMSLISGDNSSSMPQMKALFPEHTPLIYHATPEHKLKHIDNLQSHGYKVMMVGDGLNDAGALQQSNVGVSIVKKSFAFSPACDVIIEESKLSFLGSLLRLCQANQKMIMIGFAYSILFNIVGISYAVSGQLSPMIAAILMPLSSWGIILIAYLGIKYYANKYLKGANK